MQKNDRSNGKLSFWGENVTVCSAVNTPCKCTDTGLERWLPPWSLEPHVPPCWPRIRSCTSCSAVSPKPLNLQSKKECLTHWTNISKWKFLHQCSLLYIVCLWKKGGFILFLVLSHWPLHFEGQKCDFFIVTNVVFFLDVFVLITTTD